MVIFDGLNNRMVKRNTNGWGFFWSCLIPFVCLFTYPSEVFFSLSSLFHPCIGQEPGVTIIQILQLI